MPPSERRSGASSAAVREVLGQAAKCWGCLGSKALLERAHGHGEKSQCFRWLCAGREFPCAGPQVFAKGSAALEPPHLRFRSRRGHVAPRRLLGVGPSYPARFSSLAGRRRRRRRRARCLPGLVVFRGWRRGALLPGNRLSMRPVGSVPCCVTVLVVLRGLRKWRRWSCVLGSLSLGCRLVCPSGLGEQRDVKRNHTSPSRIGSFVKTLRFIIKLQPFSPINPFHPSRPGWSRGEAGLAVQGLGPSSRSRNTRDPR